jgi:hypothetical protein
MGASSHLKNVKIDQTKTIGDWHYADTFIKAFAWAHIKLCFDSVRTWSSNKYPLPLSLSTITRCASIGVSTTSFGASAATSFGASAATSFADMIDLTD